MTANAQIPCLVCGCTYEAGRTCLCDDVSNTVRANIAEIALLQRIATENGNDLPTKGDLVEWAEYLNAFRLKYTQRMPR